MVVKLFNVHNENCGHGFSVEDTKEPEPGLTKRDRAKLTTMIMPDLRERLQNVADRHAISTADVLEIIVED